jgi:hypothetical protein
LLETATEADILTKIGTLQAAAANADNLQKQVDDQLTKAIENTVDIAIKAKKITADKKEHFVKLGKTSGIDVLNSTLEMLTPAVKPTDVINNSGADSKATNKKFAEMNETERVDLRENDKEQYVKLFKAEYGFEPKV